MNGLARLSTGTSPVRSSPSYSQSRPVSLLLHRPIEFTHGIRLVCRQRCEIGTRSSPPGGLASRAGRPPHCVGRRHQRGRQRVALGNLIVPTRRARFASRPTAPLRGEATSTRSSAFRTWQLDRPHPAGSLREPADLPTAWGGEINEVVSVPHLAT